MNHWFLNGSQCVFCILCRSAIDSKVNFNINYVRIWHISSVKAELDNTIFAILLCAISMCHDYMTDCVM